jgi:hypothetical protein
MIEQTNPAVAMPFFSLFLRPSAPRMMPIRPVIEPIYCKPGRKQPHTKLAIPSTNEATPILLSFLNEMLFL